MSVNAYIKSGYSVPCSSQHNSIHCLRLPMENEVEVENMDCDESEFGKRTHQRLCHNYS